MKIIINIVLFLCILTLFLVNCLEKEQQIKIILDYFPHAFGNNWSYKSVGEPDWTDEIVDSYEWQGNTVYKLIRDNITPHEEWRVLMNGELRVYLEEPTSNSPYTIWLKEPLEVGKEWNFFSTDTLKVRIDALNATASTPVGEFKDLLKLDTRQLNGSADHIYFTSSFVYFAEDVGLLKVTGTKVIELFDVEIFGY